jgi:hypothetical protein
VLDAGHPNEREAEKRVRDTDGALIARGNTHKLVGGGLWPGLGLGLGTSECGWPELRRLGRRGLERIRCLHGRIRIKNWVVSRHRAETILDP